MSCLIWGFRWSDFSYSLELMPFLSPPPQNNTSSAVIKYRLPKSDCISLTTELSILLTNSRQLKSVIFNLWVWIDKVEFFEAVLSCVQQTSDCQWAVSTTIQNSTEAYRLQAWLPTCLSVPVSHGTGTVTTACLGGTKQYAHWTWTSYERLYKV